ncbi:MT-A70 family methyltransferase [Terasakiella sp. A23]|uniref:MT-A70 family methyltransferase n=1 Tax=Terasakiella sp. FCG-A23 TaxID=3080561 RepID=UPI00295573C7|nr:MT-A70 family methyltransferase [Terasakiella sp. A23]MDV7340997.1 MT-A70 family methyltransferase [Terasakiella sp. A23]
MHPNLAKTVDQLYAIRPHGGWRVVISDFPWLFKNYSGKNAVSHYDCMTIDEIIAFGKEIDGIFATDCVHLMWVTWPLMMEWHKVITELGFEYSGLGWEWIKYNPETDKYAFGGGYGTRKNLEPCLLLTRGKPKLKKTFNFFGEVEVPEGVRSVRDFIEWYPADCIRSKRREHSQKPPDQYERAETMFNGPYLDLFARPDPELAKRKGWSFFGNEVDKLLGEAA